MGLNAYWRGVKELKHYLFCSFFPVKVEWILDGEVSACTKYHTLHYLNNYILCVYMELFYSIYVNIWLLKIPTVKIITNNNIKNQPQGPEYLIYKQNDQLKNILVLSTICLLLIWMSRYCMRELFISNINFNEHMHTFASRCV